MITCVLCLCINHSVHTCNESIFCHIRLRKIIWFSHFFADKLILFLSFLKHSILIYFIYIAITFYNYRLTQSMCLVDLLINYFTINFTIIFRKIWEIAHPLLCSYIIQMCVLKHFFKIWLSTVIFLRQSYFNTTHIKSFLVINIQQYAFDRQPDPSQRKKIVSIQNSSLSLRYIENSISLKSNVTSPGNMKNKSHFNEFYQDLIDIDIIFEFLLLTIKERKIFIQLINHISEILNSIYNTLHLISILFRS